MAAPASGFWGLLVQVSGAWDWRPAVLLVMGGLAALYLRGWWRLRRTRRHGAAPGWRLAAYLIGLGCIFIALCSPLELLAKSLGGMARETARRAIGRRPVSKTAAGA